MTLQHTLAVPAASTMNMSNQFHQTWRLARSILLTGFILDSFLSQYSMDPQRAHISYISLQSSQVLLWRTGQSPGTLLTSTACCSQGKLKTRVTAATKAPLDMVLTKQKTRLSLAHCSAASALESLETVLEADPFARGDPSAPARQCKTSGKPGAQTSTSRTLNTPLCLSSPALLAERCDISVCSPDPSRTGCPCT